MGSTKYTIPDEFRDQLEYADLRETRTDEQLFTGLTKFQPVVSEKNVWAFWDSGFESMPMWCKRNVIDWIRICDQSWTIRVIDNIPDSPNYALKYLDAELLPESFKDRKMDGPYIGQHSADFIRGAALYQYGGVFMDVGCILYRDLDRYCWAQLEDPNSPFQVAAPLMYGLNIANHFVASRKGDPFIKRWHDLFCHLWKGRTNFHGIVDDPLVSFGRGIKDETTRTTEFKWDFKVDSSTVMGYIGQLLAWLRLVQIEDAEGLNAKEYWENKILCIDVLQENWGAEATIGFTETGQKLLDIFSLEIDENSNSEEQKTARNLVWRLLTRSSMQKITHGKGLTHDTHLGTLWDMPENFGKDCASGTYGDLMRYGSVHFRQTRPSIVYMEATKVETPLKKGLYEP